MIIIINLILSFWQKTGLIDNYLILSASRLPKIQYDEIMNYDLKNQVRSNNTIWKKKEKLHVQMEILSWMLKHAKKHVMT